MKRKEMVLTKLDGIQPIIWYDKEDFGERSINIYSKEGVQHIPVSADVIICDFCNTDIEDFPCPVFRDSYALCKNCYNHSILGKED